MKKKIKIKDIEKKKNIEIKSQDSIDDLPDVDVGEMVVIVKTYKVTDKHIHLTEDNKKMFNLKLQEQKQQIRKITDKTEFFEEEVDNG